MSSDRSRHWRPSLRVAVLGAATAAIAAAAGTMPASAAPIERVTAVAPDWGAAKFDGSLFFLRTVEGGYELWKTDGTAAGSTRVRALPVPDMSLLDQATIDPSVTASGPGQIVATSGKVYFLLTDGLWMSDGTADGTVRVRPNGIDGAGLHDYATDLATVGERAIFTVVSRGTSVGWSSSAEVSHWSSDGTPEGTLPLFDIGQFSRYYRYRRSDGGGASYFQRFQQGSSQVDQRIYRTDGTLAGTKLLDPASAAAEQLAGEFEGAPVTFSALPGVTPSALFYEDRGVRRSLSGSYSPLGGFSYPSARVMRGPCGSMYFQVQAGDSMSTRFPVLIGTSQGGERQFVKHISVGEHAIFGDYFAFTPGANLWLSDGTEAGTVEFRVSGRPVPARQLMVVGKWLYFVSSDAEHGEELWRTDGTPAGTSIVEDVAPGPASSAPALIGRLGNDVFFRVTDATEARGIYRLAVDPSGSGPRIPVSTPSPQPTLAPTPAPTTPPLVKRPPTGLIVQVDRRIDRSAPFRWSIYGRLGVPADLPRQACSGKVELRIARGSRVVAKTTTKVATAPGTTCAFGKTIGVDRRKLAARGGKLTATARFLGSSQLLSKQARSAVTLTYGRR